MSEFMEQPTNTPYTDEELAKVRSEAAVAGVVVPESDEALVRYLQAYEQEASYSE